MNFWDSVYWCAGCVGMCIFASFLFQNDGIRHKCITMWLTVNNVRGAVFFNLYFWVKYHASKNDRKTYTRGLAPIRKSVI